MGNLGSLTTLALGGVIRVRETLPELQSFLYLGKLDLSNNRLCGKLPPELGGLANLTGLYLGGNQLTGEIPPELGSLAFILKDLSLDGNRLGGCISDFLRDGIGYVGDIPVCAPEDHPGDTDALIALYNAWGQPDNLPNWLSREPIGEWAGVSVDVNGRVAALNLTNKGLTGGLPQELGSLESLKVLYLHGNALTGDGKCAPNVTLSLSASIMAPLGELCVTAGEFVSVSAGAEHTCGVKRDGSVACWGSNRFGQATPPAGEFASVNAGDFHNCGVKRDGSVACWGWNKVGQATPPAGKFASVSAGYDYTCGVKTDGTVACWGDELYGQEMPPEGEFASVGPGTATAAG